MSREDLAVDDPTRNTRMWRRASATAEAAGGKTISEAAWTYKYASCSLARKIVRTGIGPCPTSVSRGVAPLRVGARVTGVGEEGTTPRTRDRLAAGPRSAYCGECRGRFGDVLLLSPRGDEGVWSTRSG